MSAAPENSNIVVTKPRGCACCVPFLLVPFLAPQIKQPAEKQGIWRQGDGQLAPLVKMHILRWPSAHFEKTLRPTPGQWAGVRSDGGLGRSVGDMEVIQTKGGLFFFLLEEGKKDQFQAGAMLVMGLKGWWSGQLESMLRFGLGLRDQNGRVAINWIQTP